MISGLTRVSLSRRPEEQTASQRTTGAAPGCRRFFNFRLLTTRYRRTQSRGLRLRGLFGFLRLGADRLSRLRRRDAERPSRIDRGNFGRLGPEMRPAGRTELGFVLDHADGDAVDVRNVGATQAHRIGGTGLLLLLGIALARSRQRRNRQPRREHQTKQKRAGPERKHESPQRIPTSIDWTNCG